MTTLEGWSAPWQRLGEGRGGGGGVGVKRGKTDLVWLQNDYLDTCMLYGVPREKFVVVNSSLYYGNSITTHATFHLFLLLLLLLLLSLLPQIVSARTFTKQLKSKSNQEEKGTITVRT